MSIGPDKTQVIADSRSSRETKEVTSYMILVLKNLTYFGARGSSCPCFQTNGMFSNFKVFFRNSKLSF